MKVTVDRKELLEGVRASAKFLPTSSAIESLQHFLVEAHSGIVAVTATDLEAGRRVEIEAEVEAEGDVLVPRSLSQIVAGGVGDQVKMSADSSHLTVGIGRATNKLRLGVRDAYPTVEQGKADAVKVPIQSWHKVQAVSAACGGTKSPVPIQGVLFDGGDVVATDSYRLAWAEITEQLEHESVIVPAAAVRKLDASVSALHIGDRRVRADVEGGAWWARLIEGQFPKWYSFVERTESEDPTLTATIDTERLIAVLGRAAAVVDTSTYPVRLRFGQGEITVSAAHSESGEFEETFDAVTDWHDGSEYEAAYNGTFLRSMTEPASQVKVKLFEPNKPVRITGDGWWNVVLMPVRVKA